MKNIEMTAVFEPCDEGGFIAYVQEIQGIIHYIRTLATVNYQPYQDTLILRKVYATRYVKTLVFLVF